MSLAARGPSFEGPDTLPELTASRRTTCTTISPLFKINGRLQGGQKSKTHLELIDVEGWELLCDDAGAAPPSDPSPRAGGLYRAEAKARATEPPAASRHMRVTIPAAPPAATVTPLKCPSND